MKRWHALLLVSIVIVVFGYGTHRVLAKRAQQKREVAYQQTLRSYSELLKPGMTRVQVEKYLKENGAQFQRTCCIGQRMGTYDDLVKIGEEDPAWYCSELNVYLGFKFTSDKSHPIWDPVADEMDILKSVDIVRWQESCL